MAPRLDSRTKTIQMAISNKLEIISRKTMFPHPILAYLSVIGGFLVNLTLGAVYTYGNMAPYMLAYMRNNTLPLNKINAGNSLWIFGLSVFGIGTSMSFGGFMVPKLGSVTTILSGSWLMSLGIFLTYCTIKYHLATVALTYGLIVGIGVGIAYGTILCVPSQWFPQSKGLVTGIVVAGFGFAPITLDFIQAFYINPDISNVQIEDTANVPNSFLLMGSIYASIQIVGSLMIRLPNKSQSADLYTDDVQETTFNTLFKSVDQFQYEVDLKPQRIVFERDFWVLWISYTFNSAVAILILSLHKVFGVKLNISDIYLTVISAFGAFCNGTGRIVWGYLIDRFAYKKLMTILTFSISLMLGTFYFCSSVGKLSEKNESRRLIMYSLWVIVLHFLLSGNFSIFPVICTNTFGVKHSVINYGMLFTAYALAGIITSVTTTNMFSEDQTIYSYLTPFLVGCGLSIFSGIITQIYRGQSMRKLSIK